MRLAVTKPPNEPLSHEEEQLVEHLAAQAGLVLRNARLTEELRARLVELQASGSGSSRLRTSVRSSSSATSTTALSSSSWRSP